MKKISLFLSLLLAFAGAVKAQNSQEPKGLLVEDAAEELTDGTVIALQNRATNGGGQYFNGEDLKAANFSINVLYVVEGNAKTGMKLRRLVDGQYVGGNGTNNAAITMADNAESAVIFTAVSYGQGGDKKDDIYQSDGTIMSGTDENLLVRFKVKNQSDNTALNAQGNNVKPKYSNGKGSFGVWYVYVCRSCRGNTVTDAETELTEGTVIALQCRDYNGGGGYYFAGAKAKTADFSADNLFVVEGSAAEGIKLRRLTGDKKYIGKSTNDVIEVDETNAVTFTAKSYKDGKNGVLFDGNKNAELDNTEESLYVRFIVKDQSTFLNTRELENTPNYAGGIGGFSAWYVYKFPEDIASESDISETITKMKIADVEDLLASIKFGYKTIGCDFPVLAEGLNANEVAWPSALNDVFSGIEIENKFKLLDYAKSVIEDAKNENGNEEILDTAKEKLAEFIKISKAKAYNRNYPVSVVYKAAARYGTLYTPFAATLPAGLTLRKCTGCENNVLTLSEEGSSNAVANTAYIVEADENLDESVIGTTVQFIDFSGSLSNTQANADSPLKGTHTGMQATEGSYVLQNQGGVLGFYLVAAGTDITVPAGKCYLQLPANATSMKYLRFPDGTLTAIDGVDAAKPADAATYDLSGRRVGTMTKGLYIVDGRKVLVK